MGFMGTAELMLVLLAMVLGGMLVWLALGRRLRRTAEDRIVTETIAERVRVVGKLVGLEVSAKEIATATSGWPWLPPLLLSQARLAMIFHFEKQYYVDLTRVTARDVTELGEDRIRLRLPPIEGTLRLTDMTPYDIQDGRVLGLLDVIQMNADRQKELIRQAQAQAAELFRSNDSRYLAEARRAIERQLKALLELFNVRVDVVWAEPSDLPTDPAERAGRAPAAVGVV